MSKVKEYYIVVFVFNFLKYYTLWYTDDEDGFVLDEDSMKIKSFKDEIDTKVYAHQFGFDLKDDITEILCSDEKILFLQDIDCNAILTFWNIISDIAKSVNKSFLGDCEDVTIKKVYNKLFYGCNLPLIKKDEKDFLPKWSSDETCLMQKIIESGLQILSKELNI